jgi:hypothetical protein
LLAAGDLVRLLPEAELLEDSFRLLFRTDSAQAEVFAELAGILRTRPLS